MNQHTASEHVAAQKLRESARAYASGYTDNPEDQAAARLALLMIAAQQEAKAQGYLGNVVISQEKQE